MVKTSIRLSSPAEIPTIRPQQTMKNAHIFKILIISLIFVLLSSACFLRRQLDTNSEIEPVPNVKIPIETALPLGNPTNATSDTKNEDNFLILGNYSTISYNRSRGQANWVAWTLSGDNIGDIPRQQQFTPDNRLPNGWLQVTSFHYNGSGYDRGHMMPSGDRSKTIEANKSTFVMTNITPQTNSLNAGPWEKLESYSRSLARKNKTLYIISGGYGDHGMIRKKITIPTNFWKIIAVVSNGMDLNEKTRIIAVDMPNIDGIDDADWKEYRTTVAEIEKKTGYHFFANLPENVRNLLKEKQDDR